MGMELESEVDRSPAQHALLALKNALERGRFKPGEQLPSERSLARALKVSRAAVREAELQLVAEARLSRVRGRVVVPGGLGLPKIAKPAKASTHWRQLLAARRCLWAELVRLLARRKRPLSGDKLDDALCGYWFSYMGGGRSEGSARSYSELGRALALETGNSALVALTDFLHRELEQALPLWQVDGLVSREDEQSVHQCLIRALTGETPRAALRIVRGQLARYDAAWVEAALRFARQYGPPGASL